MKRKDLLSFEEMYRMINVFSKMGIAKLRITGGEPFVRKGIIEFLEEVSKNSNIEEINITTNGTTTKQFIPTLEKLGIKNINLSLDTLNKERFHKITRRDYFDEVYETYLALLDSSLDVKINMVVMNGKNIDDIYGMIELTKNHNVSVRFIEEMPFNGTIGQGNNSFWPHKKILNHIEKRYQFSALPNLPSSTSVNYKIEGYKGSFGVIAAFTRSFCGSCNRVRVTPQGQLKTCLYDGGVFSIRDLMRSGASNVELAEAFIKALNLRFKDGFEAEEKRLLAQPVSESMATIGG